MCFLKGRKGGAGAPLSEVWLGWEGPVQEGSVVTLARGEGDRLWPRVWEEAGTSVLMQGWAVRTESGLSYSYVTKPGVWSPGIRKVAKN